MKTQTETAETQPKTIGSIKAEQQRKIDALMKDCHVFWAFSNDQLTEGMKKHPLAEGDKYVRIGGGGFMYKSKIDTWNTGWKEINKWYKAEIKANKGARYENIRYELANHEAWYTGSIEDTMAALGSGYTKKEVWTVWHKENEKNKAI